MTDPSTSGKSLKRQIHPVVEIVNGYKHYGICTKWHQVLRNFNMTAYSGEIYALLGPHGCGKTSVLNIILGVCRLNQGFVKIFGFTPGEKLSGVPGLRVGFTPQSFGLHQEFTVNETFRYYGNMLSLKRKYINERISYVTELLYLPNGKHFIKNCTEAEKRQISFAVAILHEPELLILDEPCRGVDPVLRDTIWEHIKDLVTKEERTILMTTQNLPEASLADKIGIMRCGYQLMEGNPSELIKTYKEKSLETLYLHIYSFHLRKNAIVEKKSIEENPLIKLEKLPMAGSEGFLYTGEEPGSQPLQQLRRKMKTNCSCFKKLFKIIPNFRRLGVLMLRDILRSFRNFVWLLSFFLLPIILIVSFSFTVGMTPTNLKVAVVNFEATKNECVTDYEKYVSCQILKTMNKDIINLVYYDKYEDAEQAAFKVKVNAILIVGEKFTNQITRTMANIALNNVEIGNPDTSQLILRLDVTNRIIANTIEHTVKRAVEDYLKVATEGTKVQNATIGYPMKVDTPLFGKSESSHSEFITTGLSITLLYHMAAFVAALTLVSDRISKLATRDYLAGVRPTERVLSQMIVYGTILFIEAVIMFAAFISIRQVPIKGSIPYLILVVFLQIWTGLCFGFLIANTSATIVHASYTVFCFFSASLILCGILWPLNGQPDWLLTVVRFLPQTQAVFAVRCIIHKGISIYNEEVYLGLFIPLVWMILFTLIGVIINRITY